MNIIIVFLVVGQCLADLTCFKYGCNYENVCMHSPVATVCAGDVGNCNCYIYGNCECIETLGDFNTAFNDGAGLMNYCDSSGVSK